MAQFPRQVNLSVEAAKKLRTLGITDREDMGAYASGLIMNHNQDLEEAREAVKAAKAEASEAVRGMRLGERYLSTFGLRVIETEAGSGQWTVEQKTVTVDRTTYVEKTTEVITRRGGPWPAKYPAIVYALEIAADLHWALRCKLDDKLDRQAQAQTYDDGF